MSINQAVCSFGETAIMLSTYFVSIILDYLLIYIPSCLKFQYLVLPISYLSCSFRSHCRITRFPTLNIYTNDKKHPFRISCIQANQIEFFKSSPWSLGGEHAFFSSQLKKETDPPEKSPLPFAFVRTAFSRLGQQVVWQR